MSMLVRCGQCHATVPVPDQLEARTMQCAYCGAVQAVPDLAERERALHEREYQQMLAEQQRREERRYLQQQHREEQDRKEHRRSMRWGRVATFFSVLAAPVIISITVFDLPARLGFGEDGSDRLKLVSQQLTQASGGGCTSLSPVAARYAKSTVTELVSLPGGCLRVIAAGGPDHDDLTLRVFDGQGKEVAKSPASRDPQLEYCPPGSSASGAAPAPLRYEVVPGMMDKGRLSYAALACPAKPEPAAAPSGEAEPAKKKSRK